MEIDTRIFTDAKHESATTLKKLKAQGLMVAVVKDDSGQSIADAAGLKTLVVPGYDDAVKAVGKGEAQAAILDEPVGVFYAKEFGYHGKVVAVGKPVAAGMMTLPVLKENTMLLGILDKGISMIGDSEFEGIQEKYLGVQRAVTSRGGSDCEGQGGDASRARRRCWRSSVSARSCARSSAPCPTSSGPRTEMAATSPATRRSSGSTG